MLRVYFHHIIFNVELRNYINDLRNIVLRVFHSILIVWSSFVWWPEGDMEKKNVVSIIPFKQ